MPQFSKYPSRAAGHTLFSNSVHPADTQPAIKHTTLPAGDLNVHVSSINREAMSLG